MRTVTSITVFNDAIGMRMSITYSEIDESTGKVTSDNSRIYRVVTAIETKNLANELLDYAQEFVDAVEQQIV